MAAKKENADIQKGDVLQAVVIADSFDSKFGPLTSTRPRCLLPLGNRPILSYTLEYLKTSGVQEVFVYCTSFAPAIKSFLERWQNAQTSKSLVAIAITNEECRSLGDAMRDLDAKGLLRNDFILVHGDTIGNVDLAPIFSKHKERVKEDKNCTMTLAYKHAHPGHQSRTTDAELCLVVNGNKKILHHARVGVDKRVDIPLEVLDQDESGEVEIRHDLADPGIVVCSQTVPPLFADNFDCQTLDEFVKGVIQDDLTDNTLYMCELPNDSYVMRVSNPYLYFEAHRDLIHRWLYPIVPERPFGSECSSLSYHRRNIYKAQDLTMNSGSVLEGEVLVGERVTVRDKTTVAKSSIGNGCMIGSNVSIRESVLYDNVKIGDNCQVVGAIIAGNVSVGSDVVVNPKCVLGDDVQIKTKTNLPPETLLVAQPPSDGFSDSEVRTSEFGSKAFMYELEDDGDDTSDSDDDNDGDNEAHDQKGGWSTLWGSTVPSDLSDDSDTDSEKSFSGSDLSGGDRTRIQNFDIDDDAKYHTFNEEVYESLHRGAKEGVKPDNLVLEINSSRHAYAVTSTQVIQSVLSSLLLIAASNTENPEKQASKLLGEVKRTLTQFHSLLAKYVKTETAQNDCLGGLTTLCKDKELFLPIAAKILEALYDQDILSEKAIVKWFSSLQDNSSIKPKVKAFIDWLQASSEEEESSEEDE